MQQLSDAMDKTLKTDAESLQATQTKAGAMAVDLHDGFQSSVLAKVDADGKLETKCVSSAAEGKQFFGVDGKKTTKKHAKKKPAPATTPSEWETK